MMSQNDIKLGFFKLEILSTLSSDFSSLIKSLISRFIDADIKGIALQICRLQVCSGADIKDIAFHLVYVGSDLKLLDFFI